MNEILKKYSQALSQFALTAEVLDIDKFAQVLIDNGLALYAGSIIEEAKRLALSDIAKRKVIIRSAKVLSGEEKLKIKEKIGNNFIFEEVIDENLISGVVVELAGEKIDGSLSGRIKNLRTHLA